jgi:hypothetical protein
MKKSVDKMEILDKNNSLKIYNTAIRWRESLLSLLQ